ncbi:PCF11 cleavage and polyadenylation factor subunit [Phyllostomus discolor]|uniref:PCF11 cleavage and polyadenylation factor subunit n=1 Tax=Phyllostomus discolor TaxID=89673 RepID=A0A834A985_9CHIR|nr:PCF11 cleavage and polyadenylation factor subunit [Phyllostomus discolor]
MQVGIVEHSLTEKNNLVKEQDVFLLYLGVVLMLRIFHPMRAGEDMTSKSLLKVYEKSRDHHSMIVFHLSDLDMTIQINHL